MAFDPTPGFNLGITHGLTSLFSSANTDPNRNSLFNGVSTAGAAPADLSGYHSALAGGVGTPVGGRDPYTGDSGGYNATSANGSGTGNQADIATYNDNISSLQGLLGQADINRQQGEQGINQSYNRSNAQLGDQLTGTLNKYGQQETDTTKGYQRNLDTINGQARTGYQSLQALLGGSGSAGEILAPLAVSNHAGGQTNQARDGYATNLQSLNTARKDAKDQTQRAQDDLLGQKNTKLQSLITSIDQQKQNYQSQIGQQENQRRIAQGGSYQTPTAANANIAALQGEMNGLASQYAQPEFKAQNLNYQAPNLNPYLAQAAQIGGGSNQPQGASPDDPSVALQALLAQQKDKQYNPYGA